MDDVDLDHVYVFGSYGRGDAQPPESDLDVCIEVSIAEDSEYPAWQTESIISEAISQRSSDICAVTETEISHVEVSVLGERDVAHASYLESAVDLL